MSCYNSTRAIVLAKLKSCIPAILQNQIYTIFNKQHGMRNSQIYLVYTFGDAMIFAGKGIQTD